MKLHLLCFVFYFASPDLVSGESIFCSKNEDCPESGSCQNGLCVCDVGKVISSHGDRCLDMAPGIGSSCTESSQCTLLISGPSVCNEKEICSCGYGHVYLNNKCVKYQSLNETCTDETPCFDGVDLFAMTCNENGRCGCSDGYYLRGKMDCRKTAKDDGECFFDIDCENEDQYCKFKYGPLGECMDAPNIACEKDKECLKQLNNSFCADFRRNKCTCEDNFLYDIEENECVPEPTDAPEQKPEKKYIPELKFKAKLGLDQPCTNDAECKEIENSFCAAFRNKCTCLDSFIYDKNSGNCVRALGSTCLITGNSTDNSTGNSTGNYTKPECGIKHSFCNYEKNICQCPKYFVYGPYSDKCFKPTREFKHDSCGSDENCFSFGPYAICTKTNFVDVTPTCNCNSNSKYDEALKYCVPTSTSGGCKDDCRDKLHTKCIAGECICEENYIEENLKCFPDLGYPCSLAGESDCVIDHAECSKDTKICQCKEGYFQGESRECLKVIEDPEEDNTCTSDKQCFLLLNEGGICLNETCICLSSYVYDNITKKCEFIRSIGGECTSFRECLTMENTDNVRCRNGACVCDYDYHLSEDKTKCVADNGASSIEGRLLIFFITLVVTTLIFFL